MKSLDYLKLILDELVSFPDHVRIEESNDNLGTLLSVSVHSSDMGKVIGREGVTAKTLKHIVSCHGFSQKTKVSVKFLEPIRE